MCGLLQEDCDKAYQTLLAVSTVGCLGSSSNVNDAWHKDLSFNNQGMTFTILVSIHEAFHL